MRARPPETRNGPRSALARGAAHAAAAGWLLCATGLILCAAPSACRAASASASATTEPGSPSAATSASMATAAPTPSHSAAAAPSHSASSPSHTATTAQAAKMAAGTEGIGANPRSARDSTFGPRDAGPTGRVPSAASSTAKGAQHAATGGAATAQAGRPVHANAAAGATPAGTAPARLAASSAGKTRGVQTVAHLDQKLTYQYNALGRRDPFQPMIGGEFVGADVGGDAPVDVGGMKVVGIVWGTEDKFALCEDGRGQSLVMRVGDKVMNGVVEALRRDAVVVRITADGQTQSVAIPLTRKGDKSNATR